VQLRRPGVSFTGTAVWREEPPGVLVDTARCRVKLLVRVQRDGIRLESDAFDWRTGFLLLDRLLSLFRTRVSITVSVKEGGFNVLSEITSRVGVIAVILGNFAPPRRP
jgi:hypothetical protein